MFFFYKVCSLCFKPYNLLELVEIWKGCGFVSSVSMRAIRLLGNASLAFLGIFQVYPKREGQFLVGMPLTVQKCWARSLRTTFTKLERPVWAESVRKLRKNARLILIVNLSGKLLQRIVCIAIVRVFFRLITIWDKQYLLLQGYWFVFGRTLHRHILNALKPVGK